jgi:polyphosphate kinase 2 (PPK2 family)
VNPLDEESELELEDRQLERIASDGRETPEPEDRERRSACFLELFRLQRELVKLQDWVVATKYKVVILSEGRDAAGKGGEIVLFDRS